MVAFKSTSIPEIVYKKEFLASTTDEFIENIEMVSNVLSKELRIETRNFVVNNFSWNKTFKNLFDLYQSLYFSNWF